MNIHNIYELFSPYFRGKRFEKFVSILNPNRHKTKILDVGGYPKYWEYYEPVAAETDVLNIHQVEYDESESLHNIKTVIGNGCDLHYDDKSFDIVHSNSVIEHVGTWENQQKFASEVRRVGKEIWIQTPASESFMEPHYLTPFVHWLPKNLRGKIARNFTIWGWITRPSKEAINERLDEIRLISREEMNILFPDCQIISEKFLGVFIKSYIAVRKN